MSENTVKENILKCALELFSSKGYEAVSVQEIVSMAGITKPNFTVALMKMLILQ